MCWPLTKVNDYYFGPKQGKRLMCVSHNKSCTFVCIKNYVCVCVCTYVSVENRVRTYLILGSQGGSLDFSPEKQIIMARRRVLLARRENVFFLCVTYTTWFLVYCCYCNCCCVFL